MEEVLYSEKEIAIFNGIVDLMKEGANPYSIKVSDIAKSANIGKGTIYDYFTSKEEAISEAILYSLINEIRHGYHRIKYRTTFKEKFYETLYIVMDSVDNNISIFNMLLSVRGVQEFYEYLLDDRMELSKCISMVNSVIAHLVESGLDEGIIGESGNDYYQTMVINSAIIGFAQYASKKSLYTGVDRDEAMRAAYTLVIRGLN